MIGKPQSLIQKFSTRDGTLAKDSNMINCFAEEGDDGSGVVILRPGMSLSPNSVALPAHPAQGMTAVIPVFGGSVQTEAVAIWNDTVYVFEGGPYAGTAIPTVVTAGLPYELLAVPTPGPSALYGVLLQGAQNNGLWFMQSPYNLTPLKIIPANFASSAAYPTNANSHMFMAPGIVNLDGTYYVMTQVDSNLGAVQGVIYGSAINDPTSWTALNSIVVDPAIGVPVCLWRHLNYVLAMCAQGIEIFYDNGNPPPGSPLSVVPNAEMNIGCTAPYCVARVLDTSVFVGQVPGEGRCVMAIEGLSINRISNVFVERSLDLSTLVGATAIGFSSFGHDFYILNLPDLGFSLAYDFKTKMWNPWQSGTNSFVGVNYCAAAGYDLLQANNGQVFRLNSTLGTDNGVAITATITTDSDNYNTWDKKFCQVLYLDTDNINANMSVSYSDDDYTTYSTPYNVNLNKPRKQMRNLGSFFYRAFKFVYNGGSPCRFYTYQLGESREQSQ